jgi:hypothetical protein
MKLFHIHKWKYYRKLVTIKGFKNRQPFQVSIQIRECKTCNKKQHHMMPTCSNKHYNWKNIENNIL